MALPFGYRIAVRDTLGADGPIRKFEIKTRDGVVATLTAIVDPTHVWIDGLQVDPAVRRRGLATALLTAVLDVYADRTVELIVLPDKQDAPMNAEQLGEFYARFGFAAAKNVVGFYGAKVTRPPATNLAAAGGVVV